MRSLSAAMNQLDLSSGDVLCIVEHSSLGGTGAFRAIGPSAWTAECDSADRTVQMSTDWKDWEYWVNAFPEYDDLNFDIDSDEWAKAYVPFEPIGKKQVGRLVYQVIGKDGQVFNPQNIRYLSPGDRGYPNNLPALDPSQGIDLSNLTGVFAGLNLVASVANLAVSCVILHKISKLEKQIDAAKREILDKLDVIDQKITRIDIRVQEINLRESLNYLAKSCVRGNTIDLVEIKKFQRDIDGFIRSLKPFEYGNFTGQFDLAYDMRERLTAFYSFLFHTRAMVAQAHNIRVQGGPSRGDLVGQSHNRVHGEPNRLISIDPVIDYRPDNYIEHLIQSELKSQQLLLLPAITGTVKQKDGKHKRLSNTEKDYLSRQWVIKQKEIAILEEQSHQSGWKSEHEIAWLLNTDAGLMWRLGKELRGLGDYQSEFPEWNKATALPTQTNQLMIDCSSGQFIGLDGARDLSAT